MKGIYKILYMYKKAAIWRLIILLLFEAILECDGTVEYEVFGG